MRDDRLANPHRIGLTDAERAVFVPGRAVKTDGVKKFTTRHMNLTRSLGDLFDIKLRQNGTDRGVAGGKPVFHWVWLRKKPDAEA